MLFSMVSLDNVSWVGDQLLEARLSEVHMSHTVTARVAAAKRTMNKACCLSALSNKKVACSVLHAVSPLLVCGFRKSMCHGGKRIGSI